MVQIAASTKTNRVGAATHQSTANLTRTRDSRKRRKSRNGNMRPEREILEDRENPEIRKMHNKKKKCAKPEYHKKFFPLKMDKKRKSAKKQNRNKRRERAPLLNGCRMNTGRRRTGRANNSWLCGMDVT